MKQSYIKTTITATLRHTEHYFRAPTSTLLLHPNKIRKEMWYLKLFCTLGSM